MLPNVLPVLMVFGGMGWLKIEVDVGSMMTASIALGVAVDDTIHYLNWYREELDKLKDRKLAILAAYKHCATPTFQAAIISGLGFSVFALSAFTPTQRFGYWMPVVLWSARWRKPLAPSSSPSTASTPRCTSACGPVVIRAISPTRSGPSAAKERLLIASPPASLPTGTPW